MEVKNKGERKKLAGKIRLFKKAHNLKDIKKLNYQLSIVRRKGSRIQYIRAAFEITKTRAILQNPWSVKYIDNLSEENQILAIELEVFTIGKMKHSTEKARILAVTKYPLVISIIPKPSIEVQKKAVGINYLVIGAIKKPCKVIQLYVLQIHIDARNYIHNLCPEAREFIKNHVCKHVKPVLI